MQNLFITYEDIKNLTNHLKDKIIRTPENKPLILLSKQYHQKTFHFH